MISTRELSALPTIGTLKRLTQSLAVLDAVIEQNWEYRYYSFYSLWDTGEQMASMRNGQGDSWYCVFGEMGAFLKGFDHESIMSPWNTDSRIIWPGVLNGVPSKFSAFVKDPAFSMEDTTFCIWRGHGDGEWKTGSISYPDGNDPDGSEWMLSILDGDPNTYREWAESYYERPIGLSAVKHVYEHRPVTPAFAKELNPAADFEGVSRDLASIGYTAA